MGWFKKDVVEDYNNLDLKALKRHINNGYANLSVGWGPNNERGSFGIIVDLSVPSIRFMYSRTDKNTGEKQDFDYTIPLAATKCFFGGYRYWFRCQGIKDGVACNKRVRVLYSGNPYFVCRHCLDLSYKSRQETRYRDPAFMAMKSTFDMYELLDELQEPKKKQYKGSPTKEFRKYCNRLEKAYNKARMWRS